MPLSQDVRYGLRSLLRAPTFTAAAVVTLALGIGANAAVFSVVNAVLLRPLPVDRPHEIVSVFTSDFSGPTYGASSFADYQDFRSRSDVFAGLMGYTPAPFTLRGDTETERLIGALVTGNYFDVLGLAPAAGRLLRPDDDREGATPAVVISYGLWQGRFGGNRAVIDRTLTLDASSFTVVGVAPQGFTGVVPQQVPQVWMPLRAARTASVLNEAFLTSRSSRGLMLTGRLRAGVTPRQAQAALDVLAAQLHAAYPEQWTDVTRARRRVTVAAERDARFGSMRSTLVRVATLLLAVVGLILLLACANLASLLLARAAARRRDIGTRLLLGASQSSVVRQLLTESVLLAAAAAVAGGVMAWATVRVLGHAATALPLMPAIDFAMDLRVLAFTAAVAFGSALLFGLAPALKSSRVDPVNVLRDGYVFTLGARRLGLRDVLVVFQMAISLLMLIVGGLFLRSLLNVQQVDPGFTARNVALLTIETPREYAPAAGLALQDRIVERVSALPGVESAGFGRFPPLSGLATGRAPVALDGYTPRPGEDMEFFFNPVSPGYLETLGVPLAQGRSFSNADLQAGRNVVVVNETFATRFWPGQDAVGRQIRLGNATGPLFDVVGVARDSKYRTLGEERAPHMYIPLVGPGYRPRVTLLVRTSGDPTSLLPALRAEINGVDRAVPVFDVRTFEDHLALTLAPATLGSTLLGVFAMLGLVLAAVGLYGVMAFAISRRTREIGIRMALGATRRAVLTLVLGDGFRLVGSGIVLGLAAALFVAAPLEALLYGITAPDAEVISVSLALLLDAATAASYFPTRRAVSVNPVETLRVE
ncbi:MAG TPA: ABC transporter permease [Vicinamibacterales bacterium]